MSNEIRIDNIMEFRAVDEEKREVTGIAVPFNKVIDFGGMKESFARGAIENVEGAKLAFRHGEVIGVITHGEETEDGYLIRAVISDTTQGRDAWTLVKDGAITQFSVGFSPVKTSQRGGVNVREKVQLKEVSLVPWGAYGANASISEFREEAHAAPVADITQNKENTMNNETTAPEVDELREQVSDLERRMAVLADSNSNTEEVVSHFRSGGEWLHALAEGDANAVAEVRAYTGGTFADNDNATRPAWVTAALKLNEEKRPVLNVFRKAALPATGLSYVYPQVTGVAGTVGEQVTEGADLPYLEVTVGSATATIQTYGGYTSLSRQEIERSDVGMLEINLRHLFNQYAKATEAAVRNALVNATGVNTGFLAADSTVDLIDMVLDSAALISDNSKGAQAEVILVSRDVFKRLAHMTDSTNRPLFVINGDGVNSLGNANVRGASANIAGFPVVRVDSLPANSLYVLSSEALTVREDATKSLQDENIINLTKDFSVYGYLSVDLTNPLAIVRVDADLVA